MEVVLTKEEIKRYTDEIIAYNVMKEFEEELNTENKISHLEFDAEKNVSYLIKKAEENEPSISSDLKSCLVEGCHFEGFKDRIKKPKRLREKIISDAHKSFGGDYLSAANSVYDVLRYTIILPYERHFEYLDNFLNELIDMDYQVVRVKNKWGEDYCKGVSVILSSQDGFPFEIQFHTQENYDIKEIYSREPYNLYRNQNAPGILRNRANQLRVYYHSLSKLPEGALEYEFHPRNKSK